MRILRAVNKRIFKTVKGTIYARTGHIKLFEKTNWFRRLTDYRQFAKTKSMIIFINFLSLIDTETHLLKMLISA